METLNLPAYDFSTRQKGDRTFIYDAIRQKYVRLTPEEWVRQHFVQYLIQARGVPRGLVVIEHRFTYQGMPRRADIVVHDRQGQPLLMTECKAPEVAIQQETFDQVARYNRVIQARYLIVTNGFDHYCCRIDYETRGYEFLEEVPPYEDL